MVGGKEKDRNSEKRIFHSPFVLSLCTRTPECTSGSIYSMCIPGEQARGMGGCHSSYSDKENHFSEAFAAAEPKIKNGIIILIPVCKTKAQMCVAFDLLPRNLF